MDLKVTKLVTNLDNINVAHRKEKNFKRSMTLISYDKKAGIKTPVQVDFFGTKAKTYAVLWLSCNGVYNSGSCGVSGGGFHKDSAALQGALSSAGIHLDFDISGVGESAMVDALNAIAEYLKLDEYIVNSRGS